MESTNMEDFQVIKYMYVCTCVCMYVGIHQKRMISLTHADVYIYVCMYMNECIYMNTVCMYVCVYVGMYICMYVCRECSIYSVPC